MPDPRVLAADVETELVEKKSRFLTRLHRVEDVEQADALLRTARAEHPDARHHCTALVLGETPERAQMHRSNDDGEPAGTAGMPMLQALLHAGLVDAFAIVIRYFGGVKLGAGGLVRAYTDAVAQALLHAEKVPLQRLLTQQCALPYALEGWLRRELEQAGAQLTAVEHQAQVRLQWQLPEPAAAMLAQRINDGGQGRIAWLEHW